jgi:hypothetical protein
VFGQEGPIEPLRFDNPNVYAFVKWSADRRQRALIILNKDRSSRQAVRLQPAARFVNSTVRVEELSPDGKLELSPDFQTGFLKPSGCYAFWAQAA